MNYRDIRTFGAVGDGMTKDTAAIQAAIDDCAQAGGGTVYIPPGKYVTGTLRLQDHMTLWLEAGAVLQASTDREDYDFAEVYSTCKYPVVYPGLLYGSNLKNVTITGTGCIDGQDLAFWAAKDTIGEGWNSTPSRYDPLEWRPMLILLEACSNIRISGIELCNSPVYSGWIIDCDRVNLQGLNILNHFYGPNSDGFHFSSCRYVHITSCHFRTGDDSIAIDSNGCQSSCHFTISDCTFDTSVNAFRIYTGLDPWIKEASYSSISDISISNCSVFNAAGVLNVTAEHGQIERISVSNMTVRMEQEGTAIFLMSNYGTIRHVHLNHWLVHSNGACTVIGLPDDCIEEVSLTHIQFEIAAKKKLYGLEIPEPIPSYAHHHFAPYGIYLRNVQTIRMDQVSLVWQDGEYDGSWSAISCKRIKRLQIRGFTGRQAGNGDQAPAIAMVDVESASVSNCTALPGTTVFLRTSGSEAGEVQLFDNDLREAREVSST
ncbi:glycoside hydrolase family 28 protein [Cohnella sp.]|uniref:glycoside hydrolase family 28 protein n=1 Tax=Cohnella sp. TaxID=1883426 RepID=UPI003703A6B0